MDVYSSIRILNLESFHWILLFSSVFSNTSKFSPMFCRSPSHCIYLYFRWSHTSSSGVADLLPLSSVSAPLERVWSTLSIEWVWLGCWGAWSVCCWGVWSCILWQTLIIPRLVLGVTMGGDPFLLLGAREERWWRLYPPSPLSRFKPFPPFLTLLFPHFSLQTQYFAPNFPLSHSQLIQLTLWCFRNALLLFWLPSFWHKRVGPSGCRCSIIQYMGKTWQ